MLGRSVLLNVGGQVLLLLVGFVSSLLLARWLGPADRGLLAVMIEVAGVGLVVAGLGLPLAVVYYASRADAPAGALLGNNLAYTALLTILFVPGCWIFHRQIADLVGHGRGGTTWVLAAALVPVTFLNWTTSNQLLGRLQFGVFNLLMVLSKVVIVLVIVVLIGVAGLGVGAGVAANISGGVVLIIGSMVLVLQHARPALDRRLFARTLNYGLRVQVGTVFQTLNYRLDIIVLQFFRPLAQVGYYVVAEIMAELVILVANGFQSSVQPLISHYEGEDRQAETTKMAVRHHGLLAAAAIAANAAFSPLVIWYGYGPSFHAALAPFFVLLPGMWFLGTGTVIAGDLRGRGRPGIPSVLAGAAVVATVGLDLALIPPLGVMGAAVASLVAYTIYGVGSLVALARVSEIPVRELVVPQRRDLGVYRAALSRAYAAVSRGRTPAPRVPD
jgi:O-antigen/teichoic acid export membrane protein